MGIIMAESRQPFDQYSQQNVYGYAYGFGFGFGSTSTSSSLLHGPHDPPHLSSQRSLQSIPSLTSSSKPHHQNANLYHCLSSFRPHSTYVSSIAVSGTSIFTGSSDREIGTWGNYNNTNSNNNNIIVAGNGGAVKSLVVSGNKLFSAHQDHKIRVWKIDRNISIDQDHDDPDHRDQNYRTKYTRLATLPTLGDRAARLLMPGNHVQIRRHKKCTWVHHVDAVSALVLSADESLLYSVSWDRTLKVWRTTDFKCLESVRDAHDDAINAVVLSQDGVVYTGSADKKIKAWRRSPGEKKHSLVATLEKHNSGVNALALSDDGSFLYSGASDRSIVVWEMKSSDDEEEGGLVAVVGALRGHGKAILCLAVVSDLVFSGSADKTVRVWRGFESKYYCCLAVLEGHNGPVKCLTAVIDRCNDINQSEANSSSYLIYSGGLDCEVKVWQFILPHHDHLDL